MTDTQSLEPPSFNNDSFRPQHPVWQRFNEVFALHNERMMQRWNSCIDVVTIIGTFFSAVIIAFVIETSKGLERNTTNEILQDILHALVIPNGSSHAVLDVARTASTSHRIPFVVNSLLFVSLACCTMVSAVAMFTKIWLVEHRKIIDQPGSHYDRAIRQQEAFRGLQSWHVGGIIESLPMFLFVAFILFYVALHQHISTQESTIGYQLGVGFGITIMFCFTTSIAAAFIPNCPFRTPFSRLIKSFYDFTLRFLPKLALSKATIATLISAPIIVGVTALMTWVDCDFAILLAIPVVVQTSALKDVSRTKSRPFVGLPEWFFFTTTVTYVLASISGWFYGKRSKYTYFGANLATFTFYIFHTYLMARFGSAGPDTLEVEALAWVLGRQSASTSEFKRAALNADTEQRKDVLAHLLFPPLSSRMAYHLGDLRGPLSETDLGDEEIAELDSCVRCIEALLGFKPRKATFKEKLRNIGSVTPPDNWEEIRTQLGYLAGITCANRDTEFSSLRDRAKSVADRMTFEFESSSLLASSSHEGSRAV